MRSARPIRRVQQADYFFAPKWFSVQVFCKVSKQYSVNRIAAAASEKAKLSVKPLLRTFLSLILLPPSLALGGQSKSIAVESEPPMYILASLCGQRSEQSSESLTATSAFSSSNLGLNISPPSMQAGADELGKGSDAGVVSELFNNLPIGIVQTKSSDPSDPLHSSTIQPQPEKNVSPHPNDIHGKPKNPDSGTGLSLYKSSPSGPIASTHPPSPESSPLGWLLGRTREPGLREIQRARRRESHEYIVERVLARLVEIEAHWRREYQPSAYTDCRVAWLTVKLASEGNSEPFRQATRDILHCEPELVWPNIVTARKLKLGPEYYKWYSSIDDTPRLDIPEIKKPSSAEGFTGTVTDSKTRLDGDGVTTTHKAVEYSADFTSGQPLDPTGEAASTGYEPSPVPLPSKEKLA